MSNLSKLEYILNLKSHHVVMWFWILIHVLKGSSDWTLMHISKCKTSSSNVDAASLHNFDVSWRDLVCQHCYYKTLLLAPWNKRPNNSSNQEAWVKLFNIPFFGDSSSNLHIHSYQTNESPCCGHIGELSNSHTPCSQMVWGVERALSHKFNLQGICRMFGSCEMCGWLDNYGLSCV